MGRVIRRIVRRIKYCSLGVVLSAAVYHRWQYRRSAVVPLQQCSSSNNDTDNMLHGQQGNATTPFRVLSSMTLDNPFDVLVVGGNLIALYTAVDAAQRGLRVALITDHDFDAEMNVETVLPGAFPFIQQAIRQRDRHIFNQGLQALAAFTTWLNVAPFCMDKHTDNGLLSATQTNNKNVTKMVKMEEQKELEREIETEQNEHEHKSQQRWHLFRSFPVVKTYVPAMSWTELSEFTFAALLSTIISPLYGPWRPCTVVSPRKAQKCIKMKEDLAQGGVITHDCAFDANKATLALLRTAEALGVTLLNYASVESFEYYNAQVEDDKGNTSETAGEHSSTLIVKANVEICSSNSRANEYMPMMTTDTNNKSHSYTNNNVSNKKESPNFTFPVFTRGVINCAGNEADRIKALVPSNEKETTPFAYDSYMAYSYLVAPRSAVNFISEQLHEQENNSSEEKSKLDSKRSTRWIDKIDAFMLSSTRFILRPTCMLLPWYDNCLLIGPYTHLIESNEEKEIKLNALTAHKYDSEVNEITTMCKYAGVEIDKNQILSCLTSFMPVLRRAEAIPWLKEVVQKGYHIDISSKHNPTDNDDDTNISCNGKERLLEEQLDNTKNPNRKVTAGFVVSKDTNTTSDTLKRKKAMVDKLDAQPFIHLYGGISLFARDIAEELINTYLDNTSALSDTQRALCKPCATRYLGLLPPSHELVDLITTSKFQKLHEESPENSPPMTTINTQITHLSDLVLRRWHIGYTSPAEAVRALPILAQVLQSKLGWDAQRTEKEINDAYNAIMASAVAHKNVTHK